MTPARDTRSTQFHFLETESERHSWIPSRSRVARPRVRVDSGTRGSEASPEAREPVDRRACVRACVRAGGRAEVGGPRQGHAFPVPRLPRTSAPRVPAARSGGCGAGARSGDAASGRRRCSLRVGPQDPTGRRSHGDSQLRLHVRMNWSAFQLRRAGRCHRKGSAGARWSRRIPVFQSFPGDSRRQPPAPLWLSMALPPAHRLKQIPNHNCYLTTTFLSH
ncbi:uncharacterized protein LOC133091927 [Eubalaena glacialis]|uniref:uncharacterized protein LOC133091927 n=1 Tax=Eubalaena glacialis TaxID=27606 RepID=UPI002A599AAE|nr:uncharacterized protein LOC133091927 [Eubalaena glacialis]